MILQLTSAQGSAQSEIVISVLLLFVAIIGSVYLSSITGRYAHMARYAQGIDEIRRFLLRLTDTPKPRIYEKFLAVDQKSSPTAAQRAIGWTIWLEPTGTYQMFVAAVNSLSLGVATWLFLSALRVTQTATFQSILASLVIVLASFIVNNVYSRLVMNQLVTRLNIRLDTASEARFITRKQ